jgi:excisionase family DNA binding protein
MTQLLEGNSMTEELLTPEQVAERLQLKATTIRAWLRDGSMKGIKIASKTWRIKESDLQDWLNNKAGGEANQDI